MEALREKSHSMEKETQDEIEQIMSEIEDLRKEMSESAQEKVDHLSAGRTELHLVEDASPAEEVAAAPAEVSEPVAEETTAAAPEEEGELEGFREGAGEGSMEETLAALGEEGVEEGSLLATSLQQPSGDGTQTEDLSDEELESGIADLAAKGMEDGTETMATAEQGAGTEAGEALEAAADTLDSVANEVMEEVEKVVAKVKEEGTLTEEDLQFDDEEKYQEKEAAADSPAVADLSDTQVEDLVDDVLETAAEETVDETPETVAPPRKERVRAVPLSTPAPRAKTPPTALPQGQTHGGAMTLSVSGDIRMTLRYETGGQEITISVEDDFFHIELADGSDFRIPVRKAA